MAKKTCKSRKSGKTRVRFPTKDGTIVSFWRCDKKKSKGGSKGKGRKRGRGLPGHLIRKHNGDLAAAWREYKKNK